MTNTKALEEYIEKSGYKKSYIAKVIGLSSFGLAKKIRNENEFKATEINSLCELLGITSLKEKERIFFAK
jgi:DNA transposition AAA+ family ATPase